MKFYLTILFLAIFFTNLSFSEEIKTLDGYWFECEFSEKNSPPKDNCNMLDNDGFKFEKNNILHIKNVNSKEEKCKKNKIGQCFKANKKSIVVKLGRKDKIEFKDSNLILSFLGCNQKYKLIDKVNYLQAIPK